jgi:morn variant repeat protein
MKKFMFISCLLIFVCGCDGDIEGQSSEVKEVRQFHNANGALVREVPYNEAGQIHGIAREWDSRGDITSEITYKNGKKDGAFKWYSVFLKDKSFVKTITEGNFKDNKLVGSVKTHNENGTLSEEDIYDDKGTLLKTISWYDNGQKKSEENHGGSREFYYENGQIRFQDDGAGNTKSWYENGEQEKEYNSDGTMRSWYESGQQKSELDSNKILRYWYENGYIRRVSKTNNDGKEEFMECNENGILTSIKLLSDDKTEYISLYNRRDIQELIKEAGINENDLCKTGFLK